MEENKQPFTEEDSTERKTSDEIGEEVRQKWQREKKIERSILTVLLALVLAAAFFCAGWFGRFASLDPRARSLLWALDTAKDNYYKDFDEDELYDRIFAAFELDPYSCYYTADEYGAVEDERNGNSAGYGIAMSAFEGEGAPRFMRVAENSPARIAGIQKGMYVLGYGRDEDSLSQGSTQEFMDFVDGANGSFVIKCGFLIDGSDARTLRLTASAYTPAYCAYRDGETSFSFRYKANVSFDGSASKAEAEAVGAFTETEEPLAGLPADTAYIRLDEFNGNAAAEMKCCLAKMRERNKKNLILDLRTNGGGYMDILIEIASHMMKDAPASRALVASAKFKNGSVFNYSSANNDYGSYFTSDSRVTVLADEYTASASECLIGALVDYGTVGFDDVVLRKDEASGVARSYGKGIMQSHFRDGRGNVLKLTVAEIFWPNGKSIHGKGVTEADGAKSVAAPFIPGERDILLQTVVQSLAD